MSTPASAYTLHLLVWTGLCGLIANELEYLQYYSRQLMHLYPLALCLCLSLIELSRSEKE